MRCIVESGGFPSHYECEMAFSKLKAHLFSAVSGKIARGRASIKAPLQS